MGRSGFVSQSLVFIPCKCCCCFIISLYFGFDSDRSMFISTLKTFEFSVNFPDKSDISKSYTSSFLVAQVIIISVLLVSFGIVSSVTFDTLFYFRMLMQNVVCHCSWGTIFFNKDFSAFLYLSHFFTFITFMTFWITINTDFGLLVSLGNIK